MSTGPDISKADIRNRISQMAMDKCFFSFKFINSTILKNF